MFFLRDFPSLDALPELAVYAAYRDKDLHLGGLNDKVLFGPFDLMEHFLNFYDFMLEERSWPSLRTLCATSTFSRTLARYFVSELANITGPAEAILQSFLMARGVPVRAHLGLRYDTASGRLPEVSSRETLAGPTGIFGATLNPDNHSNAYPRDPYLFAPLLNVFLHDQDLHKLKVVVMDMGCGTGNLVKELLAWQVSAVGVDGNDAFWPQIAHFGVQADLSQSLDDQPMVSIRCGLMRSRSEVYTGHGKPDDLLNFSEETFGEEPRPSLPHWVISFDVGSHIPMQHQATFLGNLVSYAERGMIIRWGDGPHRLHMDRLEISFRQLGFQRDLVMERHFAIFVGLIGPYKGPVHVYAAELALPGGVLKDLPDGSPEPPSVEHVLSVTLAHIDPFEPSRSATHFSPGEEVWQEGEAELTASYIRFWRAYLRPWEAEQVLAPLRMHAVGFGNEYAWGGVTWTALARASWDVTEILRILLMRNASVMDGLVTLAQVDTLSSLRATIVPPGGSLVGAAGERRHLLSESSRNGLSVGHSLAMALAPDPQRPLGLHRQAWLNRLATRFGSG